MIRYHINAKGEPGLCRAKKSCPFGSDNQHYSTAEEARSTYELKMNSRLTFTALKAAEEKVRETLDMIANTGPDAVTVRGMAQAAFINYSKTISTAMMSDMSKQARDMLGALDQIRRGSRSASEIREIALRELSP